MSVSLILLSPKDKKEIDYTEDPMADAIKYGYLNLTYNLCDMFLHLPCGWLRGIKDEDYKLEEKIGHDVGGWNDKTGQELIPIIQKSIIELNFNHEKYLKYNSTNGWGTTETAFRFLNYCLIIFTLYPNAIVRTE